MDLRDHNWEYCNKCKGECDGISIQLRNSMTIRFVMSRLSNRYRPLDYYLLSEKDPNTNKDIIFILRKKIPGKDLWKIYMFKDDPDSKYFDVDVFKEALDADISGLPCNIVKKLIRFSYSSTSEIDDRSFVYVGPSIGGSTDGEPILMKYPQLYTWAVLSHRWPDDSRGENHFAVDNDKKTLLFPVKHVFRANIGEPNMKHSNDEGFIRLDILDSQSLEPVTNNFMNLLKHKRVEDNETLRIIKLLIRNLVGYFRDKGLPMRSLYTLNPELKITDVNAWHSIFEEERDMYSNKVGEIWKRTNRSTNIFINPDIEIPSYSIPIISSKIGYWYITIFFYLELPFSDIHIIKSIDDDYHDSEINKLIDRAFTYDIDYFQPVSLQLICLNILSKTLVPYERSVIPKIPISSLGKKIIGKDMFSRKIIDAAIEEGKDELGCK